jgi:formate dehydrogenase subunit beta
MFIGIGPGDNEMNNYWSIETHGDPLGTLHDFIRYVWLAADLDGMLVTLGGEDDLHAVPQFITEAASINQVNPFKPLMEINAARLIPSLLAAHSGEKVAVLLRPCEMRALTEMSKHIPIQLDHLLTFSVDCLGTLPADEYQWRLERAAQTLTSDNQASADRTDDLAQEALKFARQGGIIPYRYRAACQVCPSPAASGAQVNLHVLGLPVRQKMLLSINDANLGLDIHLDRYNISLADDDLISQHERILSRMCERHERTMDRINEGLGTLLPTDVDALIHQLEGCTDCQHCMDVCPICSIDRPERNEEGHYDRSGIMRWLVSCAGCGMCEQSCPDHLPTSAIFGHIRQQLADQWDYAPGRSTNDPLPLIY